jgi:hypothetical protein
MCFGQLTTASYNRVAQYPSLESVGFHYTSFEGICKCLMVNMFQNKVRGLSRG